MPLLEHHKAIKEYYEEVKHLYPDIEFDRFLTICRSPFQAIKQWIKLGDLPIIKVKYLGQLVVFPFTVKDKIKAYQQKRAKGDMDEELFKQKMIFLNSYLEDLEREPAIIDLIDDANEKI